MMRSLQKRIKAFSMCLRERFKVNGAWPENNSTMNIHKVGMKLYTIKSQNYFKFYFTKLWFKTKMHKDRLIST